MKSTALRVNRESQKLSQTRKIPPNFLLKKNVKNQKNERSAARRTASKYRTVYHPPGSRWPHCCRTGQRSTHLPTGARLRHPLVRLWLRGVRRCGLPYQDYRPCQAPQWVCALPCHRSSAPPRRQRWPEVRPPSMLCSSSSPTLFAPALISFLLT